MKNISIFKLLILTLIMPKFAIGAIINRETALRKSIKDHIAATLAWRKHYSVNSPDFLAVERCGSALYQNSEATGCSVYVEALEFARAEVEAQDENAAGTQSEKANILSKKKAAFETVMADCRKLHSLDAVFATPVFVQT